MLVARPLSMQARVGRALQRYEGDVRLTCGVIPFYEGRVVLVSSQSSGRWILPKGGWELDEEANEAAAREAFEEAGVLGHIGTYVKSWDGVEVEAHADIRSSKPKTNIQTNNNNNQNSALPDVKYTSKGRPVRMILFTMDVTEMLSRWPESQQRRRALFDIEVRG